jgi:hypothetical protein
MKPSGFANVPDTGHFVNALLAHAPTGRLEDGFSGDGFILGKFSAFSTCNSGSPMMSLTESWRLAPYRNWVFNSSASVGVPQAGGTSGPATCFPYADSVKRVYGVHANKAGWIAHWIYPFGSTTPIYSATSVQTPWPTLYLGYKGITYLVVSSGNVTWALYFTNVSSGTF